MAVFAQDYTLDDGYKEQAAPDSRDKLLDTIRKIQSLEKSLEILNAERINLKEENKFLRNSLRIEQENRGDSDEAADKKTKQIDELKTLEKR